LYFEFFDFENLLPPSPPLGPKNKKSLIKKCFDFENVFCHRQYGDAVGIVCINKDLE
jgi:hypothetical protein